MHFFCVAVATILPGLVGGHPHLVLPEPLEQEHPRRPRVHRVLIRIVEQYTSLIRQYAERVSDVGMRRGRREYVVTPRHQQLAFDDPLEADVPGHPVGAVSENGGRCMWPSDPAMGS